MLFRNAAMVDYFFFQMMDDIRVDNETVLLMQICVSILISKHINSTILTFVMSAHLYNSGVFLLAVNELFCG